MKKKIEEIAKREIAELTEKKITRKQAIKKTGLIAVSAATMMMLLSSNAQAQASNPGGEPVWGGN